MTAKLRALLVSAGLLLASGLSAIVYFVSNGVTDAQLVDAGINLCSQFRAIRLSVKFPDSGYGTVQAEASLCPDAGFGSEIIVEGVPPGSIILHGGPRVIGNATQRSKAVSIAHECGCQPDAGTCTATGPDGGVGVLPIWTIAGPGYPWTAPSAACLPLSCGETWAGNAWPQECPKR